ncbi:MAG TPA: HD domain-containing phosphohydrolase, partial [Candidatus Synoicihabitans sp.]|nr:HD domain-containing phosphohydrolase [Candidatus Synoicihabitans sp.]
GPAGSVKMLTDVLGLVAPEALGRGQRLRDSIRQFGQLIGAGSYWELELGALLSNLGYAAVPPTILRKVASDLPLAPVETGILRRVPKIGHDLLAAIPRLSGVAAIVLYQNQQYDGGGFPGDGLGGAGLPLGARLLKILADRATLEADGIVKQRARDLMVSREGYYDPELLARCFQCFPDFLAQPLSSELPVRALRVAELRADQVVVSDITTPQNLVLVTAGNRLAAMTLERLRNYAELGEVKEPVLVQDAEKEVLPKPPVA